MDKRMSPEISSPQLASVQSVGVAAKRVYDILCSFCGLVVLSPVFFLISAMIKLGDGGSIFYRQTRIGLNGRPFQIIKFRSMVAGADRSGPSITRQGDERITRIGRFLRKSKLDELPQLWNVLKGDMSLVGPRPEVPRYIEHFTPDQRRILNYKPGITDMASIYFRNEEKLLRNAQDVEKFYLEQCLPRKLKLNLGYAARANLWTDTWMILQTLCPYWIGLLAVYSLILLTAFWMSYWVLSDFASPVMPLGKIGFQVAATITLQLVCLTWRNQCHGLLSYFSIPELRQVGMALSSAAAVLAVCWSVNHSWLRPNLIVIDFVLSLIFLSAFRLLLRRCRERAAGEEDLIARPPPRVGIIGAGSLGAQVARDLILQKRSRRRVIAFFDDDFTTWQKRIHEIPVVGMPECLLEGWAARLDEVIIALPPASETRIREIDQLLRTAGLKASTMPSPVKFSRDVEGPPFAEPCQTPLL